ncbi:uncharacterized protein BDR25DRAFT_306087 [Lindgomyces ingoldianus]|uniref:Uncharacterized protein n=1 Tax=Lindgomyces ingoldianus TaxID=673940 RepID=A0ACB6QHW0_9PLEO|nr:uncharacterized protein BDR25DRAFT_306087 [Lindgomyces ingoldianus]KAF2466604.1 hypothetical protein BDR25DRAFT_306087 [Lindgomyces ingoldianus]
MAFGHNPMIRDLNALSLQAPHINPNTQQASDLLSLSPSFSSWILHHQNLEELQMLSGFEAVPGVSPNAFYGNFEQYHSFQKA